MIRVLGLVLAVGLGISPALAAGEADVSLATCLRDGFEIKAAFSDNNGGAYVVLQKGTNAFMCHSNPSPRCEKLN